MIKLDLKGLENKEMWWAYVIFSLAIFIPMITFVLVVIRFYKVVGANEIGVVSGLNATHRVADTGEKKNFVVIKGGGRIVFPRVNKFHIIHLRPREINLSVDVKTKEYFQLTLPLVLVYHVNAEDQLQMYRAVETISGMGDSEINKVVDDLIKGYMRETIAGMSFEEVHEDRKKLQSDIERHIQEKFEEFGLQVTSLVIKDIDGENADIVINRKVKRYDAAVKNIEESEEARLEAEREENVQKARVAKETAKFSADLEINQIEQQKIAKEEKAILLKERDIKIARLDKELKERESAAIFTQGAKIAEIESSKNIELTEINKKKEVGLKSFLLAEELASKERETQIIQREAERDVSLNAYAAAKEEQLAEQKNTREVDQDRLVNLTVLQELKSAEYEVNLKNYKAEHLPQVEIQRQREELEAEIKKAVLVIESLGRLSAAENLQAANVFEAQGALKLDEAAAAGNQAKLLAEAEGLKAKLFADVDSRKALADVFQNLDEAAQFFVFFKDTLEQSPEILRALVGAPGLAGVFGEIAKPLGQIESIKIVDVGGDNTSRHLSNLAELSPQIFLNFLSKFKAAGFGDILSRFGISNDLIDVLSEASKNNSFEKS